MSDPIEGVASGSKRDLDGVPVSFSPSQNEFWYDQSGSVSYCRNHRGGRITGESKSRPSSTILNREMGVPVRVQYSNTSSLMDPNLWNRCPPLPIQTRSSFEVFV